MKQYYVFLDIDGVFTTGRVQFAHSAAYSMWHRFDPIAIDFMNKIHDTYNVKFVLISTWKNNYLVDDETSIHWIKSAFGNSGFRGEFAEVWKTDPENLSVMKRGGYNRANEVKDYLRYYPADDFIIFDDNDYRYKSILGIKRLVLTNPDNGILYAHMKNAWSIMGQWENKNV